LHPRRQPTILSAMPSILDQARAKIRAAKLEPLDP
jgi:hypothetical protein